MVFLAHRDRVRRALLSSAVLSGASLANRMTVIAGGAGPDVSAVLALRGAAEAPHSASQSGMQATTSTSTSTPSPR